MGVPGAKGSRLYNVRNQPQKTKGVNSFRTVTQISHRFAERVITRLASLYRHLNEGDVTSSIYT